MYMSYFEVQPVSNKYQSNSPLTYKSNAVRKPNELVLIPLKNQKTLGIVMREVEKPSFRTKTILDMHENYMWPSQALELAEWISSYYISQLSTTLTSFIPKNLQQKSKEKSIEQPPRKYADNKCLPSLTSQQQQVLKTYMSRPPAILLHGDTGSGKTRIYMEMVRDVLKSNKSALVLTPEISLVPQLFGMFDQQFGQRVIYMHSGLTAGQRKAIWLDILWQSEPYVLIGPRSALLGPHSNLGIIIVDEAHEAAYKQEQTPRYNAIRTASKLRQIHGCQLVLGSATPSVEDMYLFEAKHLPILTIPSIEKKQHGACVIVDMKNQAEFSRNRLVSNKLIELVEQALKDNKQSLVLLNRRGTARVVMCTQCGWEMVCPYCDSNLIYHGDDHSVRCHTCGFRSNPPTSCPTCSNSEILYRGIGTKAVAETLKNLFPTASIKRFDTDNLTNERFEMHYDSIKNGEVDIIIGTRIIAKGLDLPKLSVVGVLEADAGLIFPDFTAEERTYQLLYQVLGRINRGHVPGVAVIQTLQPNSKLLNQVMHGKWKNFYRNQLEHRRTYRFPPFSFMMKIVASRKTAESSEKVLKDLRSKLLSKGVAVSVELPAPCFIEKTRGFYRWQLLVRSKDRKLLQILATDIPAHFTIDIDPITAI